MQHNLLFVSCCIHPEEQSLQNNFLQNSSLNILVKKRDQRTPKKKREKVFMKCNEERKGKHAAQEAFVHSAEAHVTSQTAEVDPDSNRLIKSQKATWEKEGISI